MQTGKDLVELLREPYINLCIISPACVSLEFKHDDWGAQATGNQISWEEDCSKKGGISNHDLVGKNTL